MKNAVFIIFLSLLSTINIQAQTWEFVGLDSMVIYNLVVEGDTLWAGTRDFLLMITRDYINLLIGDNLG